MVKLVYVILYSVFLEKKNKWDLTPFGQYRVLRKFEDITVLHITSEIMTIESQNLRGSKNYSVPRYSQNFNFYNRTLL